MYVAQVTAEMKSVFKDTPHGVTHTEHVLHNAQLIAEGEDVNPATQQVVALAALMHDIGVPAAARKHGSTKGRFQELEGPPIARSILERVGVPHEVTDRICYIVGNHHSPSKIDGTDFQILWEADCLENLEHNAANRDPQKLRLEVDEKFQTNTGRSLAYARLQV